VLDVRISRRARRDIELIFTRSRANFGEAAADRYLALIMAGVSRLRTVSEPFGSYGEDGLQSGVRLLHLKHIRQTAAIRVRQPRHLLAYRADDARIELLGVLHEAMDLKARLASMR
jgi:plasmid stabilization system protein ParE